MLFAYYWNKIIKKLRFSAIKNSEIHKTSKVESGSQVVNSSFGKHTFCGYNCDIYNTEIGSFCSIANNVIIGGGMHPVEWVSTSPVFYEGRDSVKAKFSEFKRMPNKKTLIGNDVWIGEGVIIKQGIKIGHGAVIGMGSIVTKNVGNYEIFAGCPAKIIRKRFDEKIINELLEIKWWDFDDSKLKKYARYIKNPSMFIREVKGL